MEFFSIQKMLDTTINFSQFDFKNMSIDEKEMLVSNLQSKITKTNQHFEKMISKQEELSDKYILLHIQYLLDHDEYDIQDINKIIQNIKTMYEMTQQAIVDDIEAMLLDMDFNEEDEKEELELEQKINKYLKDLSIESEQQVQNIEQIEEETITYIGNLSDEKYIELIGIFKNALKIKYNLIGFFQRLSKPYIEIGFASVDIIKNVIEKIVSDKNISPSLKSFVLQEIVRFMTYSEEQ